MTVNVNRLEEWRVSLEEFLSDHKIIKFGLESNKTATRPRLVPNLRKGSWAQFRRETEVASPFPQRLTEDWLAGEALEITSVINWAVGQCCPKMLATFPAERQQGWDQMAKRKAGARTLLKKYKRDRTEQSWLLYKEARKDFRSALKAGRKKAWRDFASKTKGPKVVSSLLKGIRSRNRQSLEILPLRTGHQTPPLSLIHI